MIRRALIGLTLSAGLYLLLIDTVQLPEVYAGIAAVLLAAAGYVATAGRPDGAGPSTGAGVPLAATAGFLLRTLRTVPRDVLIVSREILAQLIRPRARRGAWASVPDGAPGDMRPEVQHALVETIGSLTPATIVVGIDRERGRRIVHELPRPNGGR